MEDKLKARVIKFFKDNNVECEETISRTDRVIENAYGFLEDLFNIVKYDLDIKTPYKCPKCSEMSDDDSINKSTKKYIEDNGNIGFGFFVCPKCNKKSHGFEWDMI